MFMLMMGPQMTLRLCLMIFMMMVTMLMFVGAVDPDSNKTSSDTSLIGRRFRPFEDEDNDYKMVVDVDVDVNENHVATHKKYNNLNNENNKTGHRKYDVMLDHHENDHRGTALVSLSRGMPKAQGCKHQPQEKQRQDGTTGDLYIKTPACMA